MCVIDNKYIIYGRRDYTEICCLAYHKATGNMAARKAAA